MRTTALPPAVQKSAGPDLGFVQQLEALPFHRYSGKVGGKFDPIESRMIVSMTVDPSREQVSFEWEMVLGGEKFSADFKVTAFAQTKPGYLKNHAYLTLQQVAGSTPFDPKLTGGVLTVGTYDKHPEALMGFRAPGDVNSHEVNILIGEPKD